MLRKKLTDLINNSVQDYMSRDDIATTFGTPIVGFADAWHPFIQSLRNHIDEIHLVPQDVIPDAKTVICYFVPFTKELAKTNDPEDRLASAQWARAYEELNALFAQLNQEIIDFLTENGFKAAVTEQATTFDQKKLVSLWSQRHFAYAAGLGTFGLNNMLITAQGCCGRYSSVVTDMDVPHAGPLPEEHCLYKKNGSCMKCVEMCPAGALSKDGYDRQKCYAICQENALVHNSYGSSYDNGSGEANSVGSEVCGKCVTGAPCAFKGF